MTAELKELNSSKSTSDWYTRHRYDPEPINKMVEFMLVNDEFLKTISPLLQDLTPFNNLKAYVMPVMKWVLEYGEKYEKAPKRYIKDIYKRKKGKFDEATQKLIEGYLETINQQYVKGIYADANIKYELEQAEKTIQEFALVWNREQVVAAKANGATPREIDEIRKSLALPTLGTEQLSVKEALRANCLSMKALCEEARNEGDPEFIIGPWCAEETINLIYGPTGLGKTWLCLITSIVVTRENPQELDIGLWTAPPVPAGVLYVDAEMPKRVIAKRAEGLIKYAGAESKERPLRIISNNRMSKATHLQMNLTSAQWRTEIFNILEEDKRFNLLILDNLGRLTPGRDENLKEHWDPIGDWLLSLKSLGVTVIMVHHAGKQLKSGPRGTSSLSDMMDNIIRLEKPEGHNSSGSAFFEIHMEKGRDLEQDIKPFRLRVITNERERSILWTMEDRPPDDFMMKKVLQLSALKGKYKMNQTDIAKRCEITQGRVSQLLKEAAQQGLWDSKKKDLTEDGCAYLEDETED
jgi:hypothetical protein